MTYLESASAHGLSNVYFCISKRYGDIKQCTVHVLIDSMDEGRHTEISKEWGITWRIGKAIFPPY